MEKLTRAAKFSNLRDQINNDKEAGFNSDELSPFQDRFNNVQETLNPSPFAQTHSNWTPFGDQPQQSYVQPEPQVQPQQQGYYQFNQQPVEQSQTYVQPQQQTYAQPTNNNSFYDNFMSAPVQNTNTNDFSSMFNTGAINTNPFVQPQTYVQPQAVQPQTYAQPQVAPTYVQPQQDYLNQTISDVNMHNLANGQPTLSQIVNDTVNEVRHNTNAYAQPTLNPNQPLDADAYNRPVQASADDQFSNTVSMEISKIMDGMNNVNSNSQFVQPQPQVVPQPTFVQPQPTFVQPQPQVVQPVDQTQTFVQPQVKEQPVEIKNISEMANEKEAMSETIPFVVSTNDEDVIEEDDEEGSNTVLNIILIVLIIVLIAVLGLIVFYILKTKGIL